MANFIIKNGSLIEYKGDDYRVVIPDTVEIIESTAFRNEYINPHIISVTMGDSVREIKDQAFYLCTGLKQLEIGQGVEIIGKYAFAGCKNLTSVTIPRGVKSLERSAFESCLSLEEIVVDEENQYYTSVDGVLYTKDKKALIAYPNGKRDKCFSVPMGTETIGVGAFGKNRWLEKIEVPQTITKIGTSAFWECKGLEEVRILGNITRLEKYTFGRCKSLKEIVVPKTVVEIRAGAFVDCVGLTRVELQEGVEIIGEKAL